ncbi:L-threonylcarbamoyladenylate synthase [Flavobacterium sp. 25HG05S-40]|uniref:L-threonylcarbamoyladenylate synthase n=1 Tax=Flavobacterium sp. 25HG05S-40 TaxID=3458682 RepID=UPI004043D782
MISKDIYQAAEWLNNDAIVALPTETVYGLAGNIYSEKAIRKIFEVKKRPHNNPLIVHVGSKEAVKEIASNVPNIAWQLMDKFWPGPLTLVLPKQSTIPDSITAGKNTVAVRMPNHPDILQLLAILPFPLAAPSANPFGSISPTSAKHVANYFDDKIPLILDGGNCKNGIESTIIGFENDQAVLYRLGAISIEHIEKEIGPINIKNFEENTPSAPGMMLSHYAPKTFSVIATDLSDAIAFYKPKKIGLLLFNTKINNKEVFHQEILSVKGNLTEAGANLYAALHRLDALDLDVIIAEKFPDNELGKAINDRLKRATVTKDFK